MTEFPKRYWIEPQFGEVFAFGTGTVCYIAKKREPNKYCDCGQCCFDGDNLCQFIQCSSKRRKDKRDVYFEEVDEEVDE